MRRNYIKTNIAINLINQLRTYPMSRKEIKQFLIDEYDKNAILRRGTDDISDKTVQRWIDDIHMVYPDGYEHRNGKYSLEIDNFPVTINENELQALNTAIKSIRNNDTSTKLLKDLAFKLWDRFQRNIKYKNPAPTVYYRKINDSDTRITSDAVVVGPRARFGVDPQIKEEIDESIINTTKITFKYKKLGKHTVRPLGIFYGDNNVYLVAIKENADGAPTDNTPRRYKLSEITELKDTHKKFIRDSSFSIEKYANSMFGAFDDHTMFDVEWRINKSVADEAKRYIFHPSQGDFIDNPDGSVTIKFRCGGLAAMCAYLFQWGGDIVPVAPAELVAEYRRRLKHVLDGLHEK